ncbi:MAG: hypothetical protein DRI86_13300 [Bacteroidetes bacterium]|nr:MAG: hypothetical protein DRI86_13300 [Bacteroidota bacterium]
MENDIIFDYLVVGSGSSGAISARSLLENNSKVLMLDVGNKDEKYSNLVPNTDFENIRRTVQSQGRFFLGDEFEAIPETDIKIGAQLSPARKAMIKDVEKLIPFISDNFNPMESLGLGGLGAGWGLGSYVYSREELLKAGLPYTEMMNSYQQVADYIGISGENDDVKKYVLGDLQNIQPALKIDNSIDKMFQKYNKSRGYFNKNRMYFGAASMAILTKDKGDRKATSYSDMDFYTDNEKSAYRPQFTIEELSKNENFRYTSGQLVVSFTEKENFVEVSSIDLKDELKRTFRARKLILASGNLGTARIVMRSFPKIKKLPLLSNPYSYLPGINISMLGRKLNAEKSSMAQAMMIYDPNGNNDDFVSLAFYTYQSLMLFRLIKESPLNFADNRILFQYLQSSFVIAGIHHPDYANENKYLELKHDEKSISNDVLIANYALSENEKEKIIDREKILKKAIRKLGVIPIKSINTGAGSSIHYGGSIPFNDTEKLGNQNKDGRLYGTKNVFIADSSGFNFLPAKGVTLSIMANAHRICTKLINNG